MMTLRVCPSTLAEGFDTYSPAARKKMFDDKAVSHYQRVPSPSTNSKYLHYLRDFFCVIL